MPSQLTEKNLDEQLRYFSNLLQRDITHDDLHRAAEIVRESIALQSGTPRDVSEYEALHPKGYLVTPAYASRLEHLMNTQTSTISENTSALLSFLLQNSREEYEILEANWRRQQDSSL